MKNSPWFWLILLLAAVVRFYNIDFGLPALLDPDEPIFAILALNLIKSGTLNPGWFGHPGSTTIYLLALIDILVFYGGRWAGHFASPQEFTARIYADPGIIILPGRLAMALFGIAGVALTYHLGARAAGRRVGLIAAALLAICPLHVALSQIIRTDVMASTAMLAAIIASHRFLLKPGTGRLLLAGLLVGIATATKWPAASILMAPLAAILQAARERGDWRTLPRRFASVGAGSVLGLALASPFIFLDSAQVARDLHGESPSHHIEATGLGLVGNLVRYVTVFVPNSLGIVGLILGIIGAVIAWRAFPRLFALLVPTALVFLVGISAQSLIWERWILPLMPILCLFVGVAADRLLAATAKSKAALRFATIGLLAMVFAAPVAALVRDLSERSNDTRTLAARWAEDHLPRGAVFAVEYFAWDMRGKGWTMLFPMGKSGCLSADDMLTGRIDFSSANRLRGSGGNVNLGTVDQAKLASCSVDFAFIKDYDRYLADPSLYRREIETYKLFLRGGRTVALFRPERGATGGPTVRVVRWDRAGTQ